MYEIGTTAQFEAAHQLVGDFGPATRLHGHTYRLEVVVRGTHLRPDGALYDLGQLRTTIDQLTAALHYRNLDDIPGLVGRNTTAEAVAHFCWEHIASSLVGRGLHSLHVRVWESPQGFAGRDELLSDQSSMADQP
jgi:6-pyruvoyltetrahydropterin/6-carboxytetrahydropterin synthase